MKKPMLAAEQPPETDAEAAAQDTLVVEIAAPPVPEALAQAAAKQPDAMAAAWGTLRTAAEAPAPVPQTMTVPPIDPSRIDVPPGYKLVPIAPSEHDHPPLGAVPSPAFDVPEPFRSTLMRTLDDHQAAADDGLTPITVRLKPSTAQYLTDRAAMFGETPADHLARILREFRLTDTQRPDLARLARNEVGMPALARPR